MGQNLYTDQKLEKTSREEGGGGIINYYSNVNLNT